MQCWTMGGGPMIELPSRAVRDYLARFGVAAIYLTSSGKLGVGRNLARAGPIAAAWCGSAIDVPTSRSSIGEQQQPATVEEAARAVLAAAARLGAVLSEHSAVMARAKTALTKLNARLATAKQTGALAFFNAEYQRRRLAARAAGARFMTYGEAKRRLRKLLAGAAAGTPIANVLQRVFEG
jgi:hypothetical protein